MGREARKVPPDWEHPTDDTGEPTPLLDSEMPAWPENIKTHLQMYETCTEGTPISPVLKTPEELARWLVDHKASWFAEHTATYEQWLDVCKGKELFGMLAVLKKGKVELQ